MSTKTEFVEFLDDYIKRIAKDRGISIEHAKSQLFGIGLKDADNNWIVKQLTKKEKTYIADSIKRIKYGNVSETLHVRAQLRLRRATNSVTEHSRTLEKLASVIFEKSPKVILDIYSF